MEMDACICCGSSGILLQDACPLCEGVGWFGDDVVNTQMRNDNGVQPCGTKQVGKDKRKHSLSSKGPGKLVQNRAAFTDIRGLLRVIGTGESELLNAYVLGSTGIDGAATSSSDIDVVAVVADTTKRKWHNVQWLLDHGWLAPPLLSSAYEGFCRDYVGLKEHDAECDVWIYTESSFRMLLAEAAPFAMECVSLPLAAKWKETVAFTLPVDVHVIARSFALVSLAHLRRARMEWLAHSGESKSSLRKKCNLHIEAWDLYKSKKALYFSLRLLHNGQQLMIRSIIEDRQSCQELKQALVGIPGDSWASHMEVYKPIHSWLCQQFAEAAEQAGVDNFDPLQVEGDVGLDPFQAL